MDTQSSNELSCLLCLENKKNKMSTLAYMNLRFRIGELRSEEEIAQVSFIVFYEMLVLFW